MTTNIPHPGITAEAEVAPDPTGMRRPDADAIDWRSARLAERACCCSARPAVVAVMPPVSGRPHETDLLLCAHHYRASRQALERAGAAVMTVVGMAVDDDLWAVGKGA